MNITGYQVDAWSIFVQKKATGKKVPTRNAADNKARPKYNFLHVLMSLSASFTVFGRSDRSIDAGP
jgi:hypothetical protein